MMFGLRKHGPDGRYGAILDIGSGSAGVAIVASDTLEDKPIIIWNYRERMVIRDHANLAVAEKDIITTVVNAVLELGNTGIRALREYDKHAVVDEIVVTISAPWAHTVSRTLSLDNSEAFSVDGKVLKDLIKKARAEASEAVGEKAVSEKFDLTIVSDETVSITANGYRVHNPFVSEVNKLTLTQLVGVTQTRFYDAIFEAIDKVMPGHEVICRTFMHLFYQALDEARPETSEVCLVDITAEATEIGIVRDNVLNQTTYAPYGMYNLAREISVLCGVTLEEALGYMRIGGSKLEQKLSSDKQQQLSTVINKYESELAKVFTKTGDALSIPRTIFLHTDHKYEDFFSKCLINGARTATNTDHSVHLITSEFFAIDKVTDSALLLSAHVFHKKLYESKYLKS